MITATFATPLSMLYHIPVKIAQNSCCILEMKPFFLSFLNLKKKKNICIQLHCVNCNMSLCYVLYVMYFQIFISFHKSYSVCWIPTNVSCSCRHWSSQFSHKFLCIQSYFNDVVQQSKQGCQGEGGHEQRHKTKLDDWRVQTVKTNECEAISLLQPDHSHGSFQDMWSLLLVLSAHVAAF